MLTVHPAGLCNTSDKGGYVSQTFPFGGPHYVEHDLTVGE